MTSSTEFFNGSAASKGSATQRFESSYRQIVETAEEGIWQIDSNAKTTFVNQAMAEMFGYAVDEMLGRDLFTFMDEESRKTAIANLARRRQGIREHHDFTFLRKDGRKIWTALATSPLYDASGAYCGSLAIVKDVTVQRRNNAVLGAQKKIFERLLIGGPDALTDALETLVSALEGVIDGVRGSILLLDKDGLHLRVGAGKSLAPDYNRAISGSAIGPHAGSCGTSAYRKELVITSDTFTDPLWKDYRALAANYNLHACWSNPILDHENRVLGTFAMYFSESRAPTHDELQLVRDATGAAALTIEYVRTVENLAESERRERTARQEAERSVKLHDDFLAIASHELKTPLTPLKMYLQLLRHALRDIQLPQTRQSDLLLNALENTDREYNRLLNLIDDLLDVSRITVGRLLLSRERCDLSRITRNTVARFAPEIERAKCTIRLSAPIAVEGEWDPARLEQIVTNLITNALKYGSGLPIEVEVTTVSKSQTARLEVRDQGIGVAAEDREKIFDRFVRVAPIQNYGGLGLGLYIVKQIVNAHHGRISVESGPGAGASFIVELPLHPIS